MDNKELTELIQSFKGYRDLLAPVQKNLQDFAGTYDSMRENIEKLNASFAGDLKAKVEELFKQMSGQAGKANDLSSQIEQLTQSAAKYTGQVGLFVAQLERIESRLSAVLDLEKRAEAQIDRLDALLEEKRKSYNLKELQAALDRYNVEVKKVSAFINTDVGAIIQESHDSLVDMKGGIDALVKKRTDEQETLQSLVNSYRATENYLKTITENRDVNEAYMFEVLDKWAVSRGVKGKK